MQDQNTHPDLRKYTEWLQTLAGGAGGRIGSWLGLTAFNSQPQSQPSSPPQGDFSVLHFAVMASPA